MTFDAIGKRNRNVIKGTGSLQRLNKASICRQQMIVGTYWRHAISACDTPGKWYLYIRIRCVATSQQQSTGTGVRFGGSVFEQLVEQPLDGSEQVRQTDAQSQHGDGNSDQHGIIIPVRLSAERSLRPAAVVVFVPRPVVGPTQLSVFVVSVSGAVITIGGAAVVTIVSAFITLKHSYLYGVQESDAPPTWRWQVVPAPDQRTAVTPVQYPFRWKLRVVDYRRTVVDDRRRGRRKVATTDRLEQHVVQNAHVGDVAGEGRSFVGVSVLKRWSRSDRTFVREW